MCTLSNVSFGSGSGGYLASNQVEINPHYGALSGRQREVYRKMLPLLRAGVLEIPLHTTCSRDEIFHAYCAVVRDHPELFYLDDDGSIEGRSRYSGNSVACFIAKPALSSECHARLQNELDRFVEGLVRFVPKGWDVYRLVRYLYMWISMRVTYDPDAPRKRTLDGAILGRRAVCAGISDAFCYLARKLGIPAGCLSVQDASSGEWHRINIVRINCINTFVDCTNGCLTSMSGGASSAFPVITYRYLCFTTEELKSSYIIGPGQSVPVCSSRAYDWFVMNNLVLGPGFRPGQLDELLASSFGTGNSSLEVKCVDKRTYRSAMRWLSSSDLFEGRFGDAVSQCVYRTRLSFYSNDKMNTIIVSWQVKKCKTQVA